jgi:hypothetical protein
VCAGCRASLTPKNRIYKVINCFNFSVVCFFFYLPVPFVGDARDLNFFPSHVVVVAAVAVDGGAYFAYSARASADPSLPSVGHFQNVMSLAQSEIPVIFWGWGFLLLWISPSPIFLRLSSSSRRPIQ